MVERLLKNSEVKQLLWRVQDVNTDYDLPYLGGYSENGETVYIDRHLPQELTYEEDGHIKTFNPHQFITMHERFEKAVMDALGWSYAHAHQAATGYERRGVLAAGLMWKPYNNCVEKYVKVDEHEKLVKVPGNLDMKPYYAPPVDRALIARMEKAMGADKDKVAKSEVDYSKGMPKSHCGHVPKWHGGSCEHFIHPFSCEKVKGYIDPTYWCKLWAKDVQ